MFSSSIAQFRSFTIHFFLFLSTFPPSVDQFSRRYKIIPSDTPANMCCIKIRLCLRLGLTLHLIFSSSLYPSFHLNTSFYKPLIHDPMNKTSHNFNDIRLRTIFSHTISYLVYNLLSILPSIFRSPAKMYEFYRKNYFIFINQKMPRL